MQLLCILLFIGVAQCDDSAIKPVHFEYLSTPDLFEFASYHQLSVQTSYITSCECMLSSNHYIQSGFIQIDKGSSYIETNLITQFKNGIGSIKNNMLGLQTDFDKDAEEKLHSVLYMTTNHYLKKEITVKKTETTLGKVTDIQQGRTILTARRCESDYFNFMKDIATVKSKYNSEQSSTNNINKNQWASLVKQYYKARETIICKTSVYISIREAFLLGSGINLCEESSNFDQSKLEIYKTDDLGNYFGIKDNNPSTLLHQAATQMYYIYKGSLAVIYLKSVVHSKCDLEMRIMIWEHVNLIRASFEHMCKNLDVLIKTTKTEAESTYGADSEDYKKIMITLYISVNKMLITVVRSTEISYLRALNFNPNRSMIKSDYSRYKFDIIDRYLKHILWVNTNAVRYDARLVNQKTCSIPTKEMCIPQNMYPLILNKLIFQSFICQANYLTVTMKTTVYDTKTVEYWMFERITVVQLKNSIVFSRCSATANKLLIINTAIYSYDLITTENNTSSTEVQEILNQITYDVVGTLCVHALEIIETSDTIDVYIDTNSNNKNDSAVAYKPGFREFTGQHFKSPSSCSNDSGSTPLPNGPSNTPSPNGPISTPTYPNQHDMSGTPSPNGPSNTPSPNSPSNTPSPNGPISTPTYPNQHDMSGTPSPNGPSNTPSPNGPSNTPSPNGPISTPTYPNQHDMSGTPSPNGPSNTPSPNGPSNTPSPNGPSNTPSPNGPSNTPTYPNQNDMSGTPSPNSPSSPPTDQGSPGSPGDSGKPTYLGSSTYPRSNDDDIDYSFVTSGLQVTQSIENFQNSIECQIEKSFSYIQKKEENEYTKVVKQSLKISQQIYQCNIDYLNNIISDSIQYISKETTIDSDEYRTALIILYRDTQEKLAIISSAMEVSLRRAANSLNTTEYIYVSQTVNFEDYIKSIYQYFKVNYEEICNNQNDAELFLKNSMTQFNLIYEKVVKAVRSVPDNSYKSFLLNYLQKTLTVYKQTTGYLKEQIVQINDFDTRIGGNSKCAFYQEIKQRMDTITGIYSGILVKCHQYSEDYSSVTIFNSEFDVVTVRIQVTRYIEITKTISKQQFIEI